MFGVAANRQDLTGQDVTSNAKSATLSGVDARLIAERSDVAAGLPEHWQQRERASFGEEVLLYHNAVVLLRNGIPHALSPT
jgi:hypothetical protein